MKTPNRYERMVLKALKQDDVDEDVGVVLTGAEVVALLRAEHRAVVRLVNNIRKYRQGTCIMLSSDKHASWISQTELLAALKRKGKR